MPTVETEKFAPSLDETSPHQNFKTKTELKSVLDFNSFKESFSYSGDWIDSFLSGIAEQMVKFVEDYTGKKIYVEAPESNSYLCINPKNRHLLILFSQNNIFDKFVWRWGYNDEPKFWRFSIAVNGPGDRSDGDFRLEYCGGSSLDSSNDAVIRAIGEALERYSLMIWRRKDLIAASYDALVKKGCDAYNPKLFAGISDEQRHQEKYNQFRFDDNSIFGWTEAENLLNNSKILVPAQIVYLSYQCLDNEPILQFGTTTGAAAGQTYEEAVYSGLCENVERDAFIIHYLNRISPPVIDIEAMEDKRIKTITAMLRRYNLNYHASLITTDIPIPVVLFVIDDPSGHPAGKIAVGAKASLDINEAIIGAFYEAQNNRVAVRDYEDQEFSEKNVRSHLDRLDSLINRARFWSILGMKKNLEFFWQGEKISNLNSRFSNLQSENQDKLLPGEKLNIVIKILKNKGYHIFVKDITIPEAKEKGFCIVKTIVPELQPMHLWERYPYLGGKRLYEVPVELGYFDKPKSMEELNKLPHPFT